MTYEYETDFIRNFDAFYDGFLLPGLRQRFQRAGPLQGLTSLLFGRVGADPGLFKAIVEKVCQAGGLTFPVASDHRLGAELSSVTFDHSEVINFRQHRDALTSGRSKGVEFIGGYIADVAEYRCHTGYGGAGPPDERSIRPEYGLEGYVCSFDLPSSIEGTFLLSGHRYVIVRWPEVSGRYGIDRVIGGHKFSQRFKLASTNEICVKTILSDAMRQYLLHLYDNVGPLTIIGADSRISLHVWTEGNTFDYREAPRNLRMTARRIAERVCIPLEMIAKLPY